jgi:two-component system chemotaxis response regulator CheB
VFYLLGRVRLIAIGVSIGGFDALEDILAQLPMSVPPIAIAMHLAPGIPNLYANRLNEILKLRTKEAQTGDVLRAGQVLIAPGYKHMKVVNMLGGLAVECYAGEKINQVLTSADILFESSANLLQKNAIGVILTGIGNDGAKGLLKMRQAGAKTIGQNEDTCAIYGMPKVAKDLGAVEFELPLNQIAKKILSLI